MTQKKIVLFIFGAFLFLRIHAEEDTVLYVKTVFAHEIKNGRNSDIKYPLKQEMLNTKGVLFREVFYDKNTKQIDYILYYFYNSDNSIRLIEKRNIDENLTSYFKYFYKSGKLISIEHYNYNRENLTSELLTVKKFINKKKQVSITTYDNQNNIILSSSTLYKNGLIHTRSITDNKSDTAYKKLYERNYNDTMIILEKEWIISKNNDTNYYTHQFKYNNHQLDTIVTYNEKEGTKYSIFTYYPQGGIFNKRIIGKNDFYYENTTYDLRKYYRKIPVIKPEF